MPLKVISIDHVQIAVPKTLEAECLAFYREVLCLPEIPKPEELRGRGAPGFKSGQSNCISAWTPSLRPKVGSTLACW